VNQSVKPWAVIGRPWVQDKEHWGKRNMKKTLILFLTAVALLGCTPEKKGYSLKQPQQRDAIETSNAVPVETKIAPIFYPMPPERPRLQLLYAFTEEKLAALSGGNKYYLRAKRPYDIGAVKGKIYISDREVKKITVLDLEKNELSQIRADYESAGIWVTDDDYKYVADFSKKRIMVFDADNHLARVFAYRDQFDKPVDVAVYGNKIYVSDLNKHSIVVLDKDSGKTIQEIGGVGKNEGSFYKPTHVIVDGDGNLYVNDFFNFRIQKFDQNGKHIKTFGHPGDTMGSFARPKGIAIDREGHIYAVDAAFENVQIFDDETTDLLLFFGGFGLDPGGMYMPNGIYIDYDNVDYFKKYADRNFKVKYLVYVGNTLGPLKLNVFGFGEWVGEPLPEKEMEGK
jgi:hypothetical protein